MAQNIAVLTHSSGFKLTFPCSSSGPRLFLEWLGNYQHEHRKDIHPLTFKISRESPDDSEIDSDIFVIRFNIILREDARSCRDYINLNS